MEVTKSIGRFGRKSGLEQLVFSSEYLDSFEIHDSPFTCALDISGKLVTKKIFNIKMQKDLQVGITSLAFWHVSCGCRIVM